MKRLAILLAACCVVTPLYAADADIQRALAHSQEVAIAQARVAAAEDALRSAKHGWFRPQISVYAGESAATGATRAGIQVSQDIDRLLTRNRDEVRQAEHRLTIAQQELTRMEQSVTREVCDARRRVQLLERVVALKAQAVQSRAAIVSLAQTQFDHGAVSLERLLSAKQAAAQAQQELWQTRGDVQQARVALAQLLGDPLPEERP